ncbi:MAG: phytanoyl-CoA dioxygenase family protein [Rhodospirillaceae bacterium]
MSDRYQASASDLSAIRCICEEYGFCLVKDVLDAAQRETLLAGMKAATEAHRGAPLPDLLGLPEVRHVYFDPRLLGIARALLGPHLVYDGEGTLNFEESIGAHTLNPFTTLHCDATGMPRDINAVWESPADAIYKAYRFGIYFQDYRQASGALKVVVGSHKGDPKAYMGARLLSYTKSNRTLGDQVLGYMEPNYPLYNLPSAPGDVVVWNLRTFHSAGARRFLADSSFAVHPDIEIQFADTPGLFAPPPGPRNALFFDYAAPAEDIDLYIKHRARPKPTGLRDMLARKSDDPEAMALAAQHGIELRFDGVIMATAAQLAMMERGVRVEESDAAIAGSRKRLYRLLLLHHEYSPYFPLFDRARMAAAPSPNAAVDSAVADMVATLKASGILAARAGVGHG